MVDLGLNFVRNIHHRNSDNEKIAVTMKTESPANLATAKLIMAEQQATKDNGIQVVEEPRKLEELTKKSKKMEQELLKKTKKEEEAAKKARKEEEIRRKKEEERSKKAKKEEEKRRKEEDKKNKKKRDKRVKREDDNKMRESEGHQETTVNIVEEVITKTKKGDEIKIKSDGHKVVTNVVQPLNKIGSKSHEIVTVSKKDDVRSEGTIKHTDQNKEFIMAEQKRSNIQQEEKSTDDVKKNTENEKQIPIPNEKSISKSSGTRIINKGKTYCQACKKKCSGEVLRVQDKYFHIACFKCTVCKNSLAQGGFFFKDGVYYCTSDYQKQFGTKCANCGQYVEGEVVSALGKTYHQKCFTCARCRQVFPGGERVTYTGKEVLCTKCIHIPVKETQSLQSSPTSATGTECAGCKEELKEGQALIALDRQWHIWCFKCKACGAVLHGEYMGKDGVPYCEKDYQKQFGVKCAYCNRYISGKVLQAGDNHHFHPTCARCTKCGDPFGDGEEMYLQGGAIWHPRCGPGPTENGTVLNGSVNGHATETDGEGKDFDRMSSSAVSEMQFSMRSRTPSLNGSLYSPYNSLNRKYSYGGPRAGSPGLILREYKTHQYPEDISRIYTYSYLTEEPTQGYLRRPIEPYDRPPTSPHFHRPASAHSMRASSKASTLRSSRSGMRALVDSIRSETPRPRSPHMNNEEPIELAHYPDAHPPNPERRRRWSDSYKGVPVSDDEDTVDGATVPEIKERKLKKEEEELSKIATGIGKVFLQNVKEREKLRQYKREHIDPRNASRTPNAAREPTYRLRYQSPVNASPSRNLDAPRAWEEDEYFDRSSSYRSSMGRSVGAIPSYNVVSALRHVPKPGYGLAPRSHTFSSTAGTATPGDFSFSGLGEKTHSTDFSSGKSDISAGSISEVDRGPLGPELATSSTYTGCLGYAPSYSPHLRRSLPNMVAPHSSEPPKIYPYHLLIITNYRLPADVDRCNLERHLSEAEFETLFQCTRPEFYRLPQWKRNELKRRARLF
ncbi:actin-binding LIM protein 3 isoform X4 [Macrosteles quadrilineatus]|uniref:actin-binding LIM protein 3 isoform X4 n=1 Tax=Macrosteles quadrilineatus TaxID=74068 RepID=UPI0023E21C90|nr:actin-binding LIM protein 3 isoform X4 [Macrosteles quadrilineatus]